MNKEICEKLGMLIVIAWIAMLCSGRINWNEIWMASCPKKEKRFMGWALGKG